MQVPGIDQEWRIAHSRAVKDDWFRVSPHSLIPAHDRPTFGGLRYYAVDVGLWFDGLRLGLMPDRIEAGERLANAGVR